MESMTGFGSAAESGLVWSVRSVNGKSLDARMRLPAGYDFLEQDVREILHRNFTRGSFNVTLEIAGNAPENDAFTVNENLLGTLCRLAVAYQKDFPDLRPASIDGLMNVRGVVETAPASQQTIKERKDALLASFSAAVKELKASRLAEGAKMAVPLKAQIDEIEKLVERAKSLAAAQPERIRNNLKAQLETLKESMPAVSEDRFMQEVSVLMLRADVREELDRLAAHVNTARELTAETGAVGKKIDFLCQELNREANTMCSKSSDVELTRIGMALKTVIDRFREQIQNIE